MDIGLELLVNKHKIKKKKYLIDKKEKDFNITNFISGKIIENLNLDLNLYSKDLIEKIIDITLKISNENKNIDISHLDKLQKNKKFNKNNGIPIKTLTVSSKDEKNKEPIIEVNKIN